MRLIGGVPESTALSTALVRVTSAACSGIGGVQRSERGLIDGGVRGVGCVGIDVCPYTGSRSPSYGSADA